MIAAALTHGDENRRGDFQGRSQEKPGSRNQERGDGEQGAGGGNGGREGWPGRRRRKTGVEMGGPAKNAAVAIVALRDPATPAEGEVFEFLRGHWPEVPEAGGIGRKDGVVTFALGDENGAIAFMPGPAPWTALEGPCSTALHWPRAAAAMKSHRAHAIAGLGGGEADPVTRALWLTALVGALAAAPNAAGIYWNAGTVVHAPEPFLEAALRMERASLPLKLWIDFRVFSEEEGSTTLFTTGLGQFGRMELEVRKSRRSAADVTSAAYNTAHYLIDRGADLRDGDTIGFSAAQTIRVRHADSKWGHPDRILSIVM